MPTKVTGAIMRKAAMWHKATGNCVAAVLFTSDNTTFLSPYELEMHTQKPDGCSIVVYAVCPVCGKLLQ
jgi:hypothetical protein